MDIERFITEEDFLTLVPFNEGGTLLDGRRYALISGERIDSENQLKMLGKPDRTGEGVVDRVFFFEVITDPVDEHRDVIFHVISAKIVDRYRFVSTQEAQKEVALILAKIKLNNKNEDEGEEK